jgi:hypothetical protein
MHVTVLTVKLLLSLFFPVKIGFLGCVPFSFPVISLDLAPYCSVIL